MVTLAGLKEGCVPDDMPSRPRDRLAHVVAGLR